MSRRHQSEFAKSWITEQAIRYVGRALAQVSASELELGGVSRILVLQLQQLGDSVVFTPTLRSLRSRFPNAEIDVLCSATSFRFYEKCPHVDHRWLATWAHAGLRGLPSAVRELASIRKRHYDLVLLDVTHISPRYALIAWLSGGRQRLGFNVDERGILLTTRLERPRDTDFIRCNLEIARVLGADTSARHPEAYFDHEDRTHARRLLATSAIRHPVIAIHAASNWQSKTWFPDRWAALADRFVIELDASVVLIGTEGERSYVDEIQTRSSSPLLSLVGHTSLTQLAALLEECDLLVGTDSGPRHVAAGSGCARVTLMSAQDRGARWQFGDPLEIVLRRSPSCSPCFLSYCSHRQCMQDISVADVFDAARLLLSHNAARDRRSAGNGIHAHSA